MPETKPNPIEEIAKELADYWYAERKHTENGRWQECYDYATTLLELELQKAKLEERNSIALDNYRGHTFSESTDWKGKYQKFIDNNERRLKALQGDK